MPPPCRKVPDAVVWNGAQLVWYRRSPPSPPPFPPYPHIPPRPPPVSTLPFPTSHIVPMSQRVPRCPQTALHENDGRGARMGEAYGTNYKGDAAFGSHSHPTANTSSPHCSTGSVISELEAFATGSRRCIATQRHLCPLPPPSMHQLPAACG